MATFVGILEIEGKLRQTDLNTEKGFFSSKFATQHFEFTLELNLRIKGLILRTKNIDILKLNFT